MGEQVPEFLVYSIRYALTSSCKAVVNLRVEIPSSWDFRLIPCDRMVVKTEAMADRMNQLPKHTVFCYTSQSRGFVFVGYTEEGNIAKIYTLILVGLDVDRFIRVRKMTEITKCVVCRIESI